MDSVWLIGAAALLLVAGASLLRRWNTPRRVSFALSAVAPSAAATEGGGVDPAMAIRQVLAQLEPLARDRGVTFTMAIGSRLVARAEPDAFRQALSDLVQHAIGRAPNGSVLISAGQQAGRVRIAVSDDGPFGNEADARTALRPVSDFLQIQGGSLEIDDRPGEGMTVTMRLPIAWAIDPATLPFAQPNASAASPA